MNTHTLLMSAALVFGFGQQEDPNATTGLQHLPSAGNHTLQRVFVPDNEAAKPAVDRESWARRLQVADLDERETNLDELVLRARTDDHLRLMLQEWAVDPSHADRAWTARLALRELGRRGTAYTLPPTSGQELRSGVTQMLELHTELQDALLRMHDPNFGGWLTEFGRDLNRILAPIQVGQSGYPSVIEDSKSMSLELGPDGVHCELSECIDGQEVKREFRADSYEELLEANPELRDHLDSESGIGLEPGSPSLDVPFYFGGEESLREFEFLAPHRTDRLGIKTAEPSPERVRSHGLDEGQGLLVLAVGPRSIASAIGIRRGDIVAEMDGVKIFAGRDVRQVLCERAEEAELKVVVINSRGQRKELVWKPDY